MTASSAGSPTNQSSRPRRKLRHATFILPHTGERVKKQITLHKSNGLVSNSTNPEAQPDETTSLLPHHTPPTGPKRSHRIWQTCQGTMVRMKTFMVSETGIGVFKCSLAYLLGSMATYVPALRMFLGRQEGKHMVATVTVYFHPARSVGNMLEAFLYAFAAAFYAAFISITSMGVGVLFTDYLHMMTLGHAVILVVFCGGGLGFVGWVKQKKGDPLVNVACSLTCLAIITVLTKEEAVKAGDFSFTKVTQVLKMIIMGVVAAMAVALLIFPISARGHLQTNLMQVTDALSDMLALITCSFLSGFDDELGHKPYLDASERHRKTYAVLGKNLHEAKYEYYVLGREREYHIIAKMVKCVQRVTQSIGGLRSAAAMQFSAVKQQALHSTNGSAQGLTRSASMLSAMSSFGLTQQTTTAPNGDLKHSVNGLTESDHDDSESAEGEDPPALEATSYQTANEMFSLFIDHLGPSMHSLAFTLKEILDDLPCGPPPKYEVVVNPKFQSSLVRAIDLYTSARSEALQLVYSQNEMNHSRPMEVEADWEEVAASCGHFSFTLLDVAEQVKDYLVILDELKLEVEEHPAGHRTWSWLKFWKRSSAKIITADDDPELAAVIDHADGLDLHIKLPSSKETTFSDSTRSDRGKSRTKQEIFRRIWNASAIFRLDDTKYAIKVGIGAALFALPSFLFATRQIYAQWRGEWGLLSYMLVCSMTIGASNTTGYQRFTGTCLGAVCALSSWEISNGNAYILAFLGWCMSYWTSYIMVAQGKGPMGRFIMLTYNLSALYAYSLSAKDYDDDEGLLNPHFKMVTIVFHRTVAVLIGCVWGIIITRSVWPISARQKLKDGLSLMWLRMGLIWKRDPLALFLEGEHPNRYMNLREENELQLFLRKLEKLQASAKSEFELRGPFPDKIYGRILKSTARMLDSFHAMNMVIMKDNVATKGEVDLLKATVRERAQLCSRICHLFSVLASSMKLEYPLTDALPNTDQTRDRLLARIFTYRRNEIAPNSDSDEDFALLYVYALVTGQLNQEIREVLRDIENLFGVMDEELLTLQ